MLVTLNERMSYAFQVLTGQISVAEVPSQFEVDLNYDDDCPYGTSYSVTVHNSVASTAVDDVEVGVCIKYGDRGIPFYSVKFGHEGEDMCSFNLPTPVVNEEPWEHTSE